MAFNWTLPTLTVNGEVGIGTDTPSEELDVIGDISATGNISATNLTLSGSANAAQFVGDGSRLTGLVTTTGNSTIAGSLTINDNLSVGGNFQLGTLSINAFSSDGNLADNSNLAVPTEQAVKTYVDNQITQVNNALDTKAALNGAADQNFTAQNLTVEGNLQVSGNLEVQGDVIARDTEHIAGNVSLGDEDSDVITIAGVVSSGHSSGAVEVNSALHTTGSLTVDGSLSVGNAIATNQLSVIEQVTGSLTIENSLQLGTGLAINEFSSDGNLTDNSNLAIPTEQAVKTYVDNALVGKANLNGAADQNFATNDLVIAGNLGIGTTTPQAKLDIVPSGSQPWLKVGGGGDGGKLWVEYGSENLAPLLVLSDLDDRPRIRFQQVGTKTEDDPEFQSWIGLAQGRSSDLAIMGGNVGIGTTSPASKLDVRGNVNINGNLNVTNNIAGGNLELRGGTNEIQFTRSILTSFLNSDSTNNLKLSLSKRQLLGEDAPTYQLWIGHPSQFRFGNQGAIFNTFATKLSVRSNGDVFVAGRLSAQNLTIRSGDKSGYVSDRFVNAVGDPIEQGDVVVLSDHPVSRFYATQNDIPIPEVDLTNRAYDTRVCGIVAKVTTEDDLPYVDNEESPIPPEVLAQISPEELQEQIPLEELPEDIAASLQSPHPFQSLVAKTEAGMNTTVVQDQQMGSMVTMGCFSYCKVDADIAPIAVGDLLTTSPTKGHGQKVLEPERAIGAIIGKALGSLSSGKGKIPVLVMLQ
ncbi:hypothetical protein [Moorena sp. SIO3I8]|uniref:hypothetical protein n=1 Tax=Moorena sp. SIO3I8 TaxID=2607833 RepID=UPI0025CF42DF|nr:hypothetical protein [Moorena sp. SIO3I8]